MSAHAVPRPTLSSSTRAANSAAPVHGQQLPLPRSRRVRISVKAPLSSPRRCLLQQSRLPLQQGVLVPPPPVRGSCHTPHSCSAAHPPPRASLPPPPVTAFETRGERADNASSAAAAALRLQLRADTCVHAASRLQPLHRSAHRRSAQRRQSESKNAGDGGGIVARQSTLHVGGWFTLTGAEGRGCARCKRQPAHAAVHTMQTCTGARDAPMAAVHRRRLTSDGAAAGGGGGGGCAVSGSRRTRWSS